MNCSRETAPLALGIRVVAQVNPRLAVADRPDLDKKVSFVPVVALPEESVSIETQDE